MNLVTFRVLWMIDSLVNLYLWKGNNLTVSTVFISFTKATSIAKYNLAEQHFSYFFPDDPPTFIFSPASRRRGRPPKKASISHVSNDKILNFRSRQISVDFSSSVFFENFQNSWNLRLTFFFFEDKLGNIA